MARQNAIGEDLDCGFREQNLAVHEQRAEYMGCRVDLRVFINILAKERVVP